jgi:hypothetical protein
MAKFEPGQSGNPGGKPRSKHLRELCRTYTAGAVTELARLALNAKGEMTRVVAIRELLDRGYGRPLQGLEVSVDDHRPDTSQDFRPLLPAEVATALGEILANAEKEMGLNPIDGQTNEDRMQRLLNQGRPIPPSLYKAWQQASGTRH